MPNPDRLYYSKHAKKVVEKIEDSKFLNLNNSNTQRLELFLFAMSLGLDSQMILDGPESFILSQSIRPEYDALLYAALIGKCSDESDLNEALQKSNVYTYAQECANSGFLVLEGYMDQEKANIVEGKLILELDKLYEQYFTIDEQLKD